MCMETKTGNKIKYMVTKTNKEETKKKKKKKNDHKRNRRLMLISKRSKKSYIHYITLHDDKCK